MDRDPSPADLHSLTEEARRLAAEKAAHVKQQARSYIDDRKASAADAIENVGDALAETAEVLRRHELELAASAADKAGRSVRDMARSLAERDLDALVRDARDFARRQPELFFAATALLGFALGRFLRSGGGRLAEPGTGGAPQGAL